jgi:hypothetical protein
VGFTPRAIRHVRPYWRFSSSRGVLSSYLWVLDLETASWDAHTQVTFLKYSVGQNRIYTYIYAVYLVISKPKIPYVHRIYMVLANPTKVPLYGTSVAPL